MKARETVISQCFKEITVTTKKAGPQSLASWMLV